MNESEELKYIDLVRFDKAYLQPSLKEYTRCFQGSPDELDRYRLAGSASGLERYYLAQLLEGYFWLALGIALDFFPGDAARLLVRQRFALVFLELPSFLRSWGFVFDPQFTDLILTALNQKEFFVKMSLKEFEYPERLASSFQSAYLLETRFSLDMDAQVFVTALNFYYEHLERALARVHVVGSAKIFNDLEELLGVPDGSTVRGFLRLLEHMTNIGYFLDHLAENSGIELQDRQLFQRRTKQLCGWRLSRGQSHAHVVLISMVQNLHKFVPSEIERHLDQRSLESELRRLLLRWKENTFTDLSSTSKGS